MFRISCFRRHAIQYCIFKKNMCILGPFDLIPVSHTLTLGYLELIKFGVTVDWKVGRPRDKFNQRYECARWSPNWMKDLAKFSTKVFPSAQNGVRLWAMEWWAMSALFHSLEGRKVSQISNKCSQSENSKKKIAKKTSAPPNPIRGALNVLPERKREWGILHI